MTGQPEKRDDDVIAKAFDSKRRLAAFFRHGWHVLEPETPLEWNWHLDALCDHIQAALEDWMAVKRWQMEERRAADQSQVFLQEMPRQRIKDLVINVPPGSSKSRIVSVFTLPWMWLHWPSWGALYLSSNPRVALRDAFLCRDVLTSDWYREWFRPEWEMRSDKMAVSDYGNTAGGSRLSFGYFSRIVGDRKDAIFLDDPNDPQEAQSEKRRLAVNLRWDSSIGNRVNDLRTSLRIGVQQRTHADDWTGHVRSKHNSFFNLCIPMEYEPSRVKDNPDVKRHEIAAVSPIGFRDPRQRHGELMDPKRFPRHVVAQEAARLGSYGAAGQLQQRPAPAEGGIWKRQWWGYWVPFGVTLTPVTVPLSNGQFHTCSQIELPSRMEFSLQSWDMAFGKSETSSMVVGQVWGLRDKNRFILDQVRSQLDFVETQTALRSLSEAWPMVELKLVENKANGPAIISSLRQEISGIVAVEPDGDKVARALAEQGTIESGFVFLPHPGLFSREVIELNPSIPESVKAMVLRTLNGGSTRSAQWVSEIVDEAAAFPNGSFKDVIDTASQALLRLRKYIAARDSNSESHSTAGTA